jgi:hypothetical protein
MVQEMAPMRRLGAQGKRRDGSEYSTGCGKAQATRRPRARKARAASVLGRSSPTFCRDRSVDSGADHAKLESDRVEPVMQMGAVTAIGPYLKMLDRLDGCQTVAGTNQVYDGEARKKLLDEINRIADNLGIDEIVAAAREHLKKIGEIPDEPGGRGEGADETGPETVTAEANGLEEPHTQAETSPDFFYWNRP